MCWLWKITLHVWQNFFKSRYQLLAAGVGDRVCALINEPSCACPEMCVCVYLSYAFANLELNYQTKFSAHSRWVFPHFDGFVGWATRRLAVDPEPIAWRHCRTALMTFYCFVMRKMFCWRRRLANFELRLAWMPLTNRVSLLIARAHKDKPRPHKASGPDKGPTNAGSRQRATPQLDERRFISAHHF